MAFGQRVGSMKTLKKTLQKGSGGGAWIKWIPKNGSMNVRFIQEPEEWVNYVEHYDTTLRTSYPCNGEQSCPGCMSGERKSHRYLANAVNLDDNERVVPLQLPKDLANRLVVKYEKWGTLLDRDIELTRSGDGLDTVYDLDADVPSRRKMDKYQALDLLKVLDDAYNSVFNGTDEEEDEDDTPKPVTRGRKKSVAAKPEPVEETEEDDDEVEVEAPKPAKKAPAKKAAAKAPEFVPDEDEDDEDEEDDTPAVLADDTDDDEPDVDDDEGYTQEQLEALPLGALRAVARDFDVDPKGKSAKAIIKEIMAQAEED